MPGLRYKHNYNYSCGCCHSATGWNDKRSRAAEKRQVRAWRSEYEDGRNVALCASDGLPCCCNNECPPGECAGWQNRQR